MEKRKKKLVVVAKILLQVKEKILLVLLKRMKLPCLNPRQIRPTKSMFFIGIEMNAGVVLDQTSAEFSKLKP